MRPACRGRCRSVLQCRALAQLFHQLGRCRRKFSRLLACDRSALQVPVIGASEDALLLAYYAAQNKSLFAAQCFVETVLDAYTSGATVDEVQAALQLKNVQHSSRLLNPQDQDILLSWVILVMLAAKEVGVQISVLQPVSTGSSAAQQQQQQHKWRQQEPQSLGDQAAAGNVQPQTLTCQQAVVKADNNSGSNTLAAAGAGAADITAKYSREVLGLMQFMKQATKLYFDEGYTVQRLQSLQAAVANDPSQGRSQFLQLMQQYTMLVMITLEVVAAAALQTQCQLTNPTTLHAPSGYTAAWLTPPMQQAAPHQTTRTSNSSRLGLVLAAAMATGKGGVRALAVRLMTAFVGGVMGAPYAMRCFIVHALEAYEAGLAAPELDQQLQDEEFLQAGGLVPTSTRPDVLQDINRQLFGRWLCIVYMAAAQLNVVFPAAAHKPGWAWCGREDEVQANAMANFVAQTLLRLQEEFATGEAVHGPDADQAPMQDPLAAKIK
eukprot:GHRR01013939.1.p1 GENE.GHRR01013939.1~~GHRR01013939.1.p1  ORF type:complete len:493 (+),score=193.26 GHRR01013939.1:64-1542(+)